MPKGSNLMAYLDWWEILSQFHFTQSAWSMSYYALFQGWLLLGKPPGCLCTPTSFITERSFRGLSWCFTPLPSPSIQKDHKSLFSLDDINSVYSLNQQRHGFPLWFLACSVYFIWKILHICLVLNLLILKIFYAES